MAVAVPQPDTIPRLAHAPFPSFAMVEGMQLQLFTPLKLMIINVHDEGGAYTEQEYRGGRGGARFEQIERVRLAAGGSLITTCKQR